MYFCISFGASPDGRDQQDGLHWVEQSKDSISFLYEFTE